LQWSISVRFRDPDFWFLGQTPRARVQWRWGFTREDNTTRLSYGTAPRAALISMTQIIGVITKEYALLASDRRLTIAEGPRAGELFDDDTCKVISLCNTCGIGYSGLAYIDGQPTHEWIASTLAEGNCIAAVQAARILEEKCTQAFLRRPQSSRPLSMLMACWADFDKPPGFRSHLCWITNSLDEAGRFLRIPRKAFSTTVCALPDDVEFLWQSIGQPLQQQRARDLERNIGPLVAREIGPKEALRLLVEEIINTSKHTNTVGQKVLGLCIPRKSVESQRRTGFSVMVAKLPDDHQAAFTYFEAGYSELIQYGPTFICGEFAGTVKTENDPSRNYQSSEMRLLHLPRKQAP